MRVLVICDRYPYPLSNGQNLRIFNYVKELQDTHCFDLICYGEPEVPQPIQVMFSKIRAVPAPPKVRARGLARIPAAFDVTQMIPASDPARDAIESMLESNQYDLIWVSGWDMIVNMPDRRSVPLLMDMVDDGTLEYKRELRKARTPRKLFWALKRYYMNVRFERHYFSNANVCLFVSERDADAFRQVCPGANAAVIHNGVDVDFFHSSGAAQEPNTMVFEGNIDFRPNTDGVLFFAKNVLPLIRQRIPDAKFYVVGKNPTPEVVALRSESIVVTGFVDDIRPYVERCSVFVCPLRSGAGIKNKILQAWSLGKAVVATPNSVGGLKYSDGQNIVLCEDAEAFADAVIELLRDPRRAAELGARARQTILSNYSWRQKAAQLEGLMQEISGAQ